MRPGKNQCVRKTNPDERKMNGNLQAGRLKQGSSYKKSLRSLRRRVKPYPL